MGNEDHVRDELDRLGRQVAETGAAVAARVGRGGPMTGHATSGDGAITVTVSPGGMLREVDIRPAVLGRHPDEVAGEILRLAQRATQSADARLHSSLDGVVGPAVTRNLTGLGMAPGAAATPEEDFGGDFGGVLR